MSEAIGQPGGAALPRPMGIGEILLYRLRVYQRHWRTLLAITAVVVVPITLLQFLIGDQVRTQGEEVANGVVVETARLGGGARRAGDGPGRDPDVPGSSPGPSPGRWRPRWPVRTPAWSRATASDSSGSGRCCW